MMTRREVLKMAAAGGLGGLAACATPASSPVPIKAAKMPALFISHGSPMVALQKNDYTKAIRRMGEELPTPKAVVIVSAHWMDPAPVMVTGLEKPPTVYDFYGFPKEL